MTESTQARSIRRLTESAAPPPMSSVAGVRGIVGESLLPEAVLRHAMAFASTRDQGKPVVVASDTRPSRQALRRLVIAALQFSGTDVIDLGVVPTPTVGIMVRERCAAGGVALTASHNPVEWNALKFFGPGGTFLNEEDNLELRNQMGAGDFRRAGALATGRVEHDTTALDVHLERVLKAIDPEAVRAKKFKVVVDCCNGAGAELAHRLLEALGCEAILFAEDPNAAFHREPEPLPENLGELSRRVREAKADLGFALDPDADRLAIVDETGRPIGEERTLCLASDAAMSASPEIKVVCANLSTTAALEKVAEKHGAKLYRSKIGEAHVVAEMRARGAVMGGEGNGGVIHSPTHPGRDAAVGMALVLQGLAASGGTLSEWNATFPDYAMLKEKLPVEGVDLDMLAEAIRSEFEAGEERCDRLDGLKIALDEGEASIHLRPSGTEPIARVFIEAPDRKRCFEIWERAQSVIAAGAKAD